eukprot:TRINITY_DN13387_c0_g1_i1.p1 TRINITY_DN13387_c0_g1~~TRINITY_DN13387_c0_g1_i1.p1  ORF type:complete len:542 (+),score=111.36 TRINITY_DN13387_c0_g1_i1:111-1736(+)
MAQFASSNDATDDSGLISLRNTFDRQLLASAFTTFIEQKYSSTDFLLKVWEQQLKVVGEDGDQFDVIVAKGKASSEVLGVIAYRYYPRGNYAVAYAFGVARAHATAAARALLRSLWNVASNRAVPSGCIAGCDCVFICSEQPPDGEHWEPPEIVDVCRSPALLRALDLKTFDLNLPPPHSVMLPPCRVPATFRLSAQTATPVSYGPDSGAQALEEYVPHVLMTPLIRSLWPPKACAEENKLLQRASAVRGGAPLLAFDSDTLWPKRSPWIVVDLLHNFDQELLESYYRELMEPSITNKDELEPLPEVLPRVRDGSSVDPQHENYSESHPILLLSDDLQISAGAMMEYWSYPNCALVTYLLVSDRYRRRGLAGILMQYVTKVADQCARRCGNFAGNNCVFLETNKLHVKNDVMVPAIRHQVFDRIGIKALDFEYVQCPLADGLAKCHDLLLTVLITDRIPRITANNAPSNAPATDYGLPSQLVHEFIDAYWRTTVPSSIGMSYLRDEDFQRMMRQCEATPYVRVVPWPTPSTEHQKLLQAKL